MTITRAIIPVAGWGTRRLPITKTIEKSMLPVGNRPLVDYVVQDCILAGISDIYFIVGQNSTQVQDYYQRNTQLESYLTANGKEEQLSFITPPQSVQFHFIVQSAGKYGTAVPVALAAEHIPEGESVVVLMGDDFIYRTDEKSETARLIAAAGEDSAMLGVEVSEKTSLFMG